MHEYFEVLKYAALVGTQQLPATLNIWTARAALRFDHGLENAVKTDDLTKPGEGLPVPQTLRVSDTRL